MMTLVIKTIGLFKLGDLFPIKISHWERILEIRLKEYETKDVKINFKTKTNKNIVLFPKLIDLYYKWFSK